MTKIFLKDPLVRNIWYLSLLAFVLSLQVLIITAFIYQFIPMTMDPITQGVPEALLKTFKPNRNHLFYHVFVFAAIAGQVIMLFIYRKRLEMPELAGKIQKFLICESIWVSWQLFAVFKILQYDNPSWARILLYAGFVAAILGKVFWPEISRNFNAFQEFLCGDKPDLWRKLADGGIVLLLIATIMIPDVEKALLRLAIIDNNNHFDQWLMAPLWAYHKGLVPALHVFNPLNWGMPVLVHFLAGFMGGVTYGHVIQVLCLLAVVYYIAFYYLFRTWLGILPAIFGVLMAVKLQMFNLGITPLIWAFPGQSILRHLFDATVFFCFLLFARGQGEKYLWLAGALIGVSLACVFDTGIYLVGAFYAYVAVLLTFKDTRSLLCPHARQWRKILWLALVPWYLMLLVMVVFLGASILHTGFWVNSFKDIPRWLAGDEQIPIFTCLKDRNFFAFFASFVPPVIYAAGAAIAVRMVYLRRWSSAKLFLIPLSVYGLGVYAHFLWHSSTNYYYMVPLPLVGCLCFWGMQGLGTLSQKKQRLTKLVLVALAGIALFTNHYFINYPNIFSLAEVNGDQEKADYHANFSFDADADFVRHWTLPSEQVPLICGFETQILLKADRIPFFYDSLTMISQMTLKQYVKQLDEKKPRQVIIDKRLLNGNAPAALSVLMDYIKADYHYTGQQSDLLALLQRNPGE